MLPAGHRRTTKNMPEGQKEQSAKSLGRLEQVDLRTVWIQEATGFTPWLAQPDNLDLLGQTLGLNLAPESVEAALGSFRADIVCRDTGTDAHVLIENQLERTDHDHLGKLLTYAASLEAVTVVWLAATFRDEHRAALDWLNRITPSDFRFFGVEIELWRIGDSPEAPKFNVVSMPNDWSRSVATSMGTPRLSETKLRQLEYWAGLQTTLDSQNGPIAGNRKPQPQHWMPYPIGRAEFYLAAVANTRERLARAELYLIGDEAAERLARLEAQRDEIEGELGYPLEWGDQSPTARDRRISCYLRDIDAEDESDWPRQHQWLAERLNQLHRAFVERIRAL